MSTLTTRIGGYLFRVITELNGRKTGAFFAESVDGRRTSFMDLPYELRSTYSQADGQTYPIILAATHAVDELYARVDNVAGMHHYDDEHDQFECETCKIADAMVYRMYVGRNY